MDWYKQSSEEVMQNLKSSKNGLSDTEVKKRFLKYGENILRKLRTISKLKVLLSQFNSFLIYILIIAGIISIFIGHTIDAVVIFGIVFLNSLIGFFQEYKAEEIIEKLRRSLDYKVSVLRAGVRKEIDSRSLVPGDIVLLDAGDRVLADCRIIKKEDFRVDEAVLTGESFPVEKTVEEIKEQTVLAERKNMLYAGTTVVRGSATAVVVETGRNTEFGKLAELVQKTKAEKTPLEKKLNSFSKKISIVILILVALTFGIGLYVGKPSFEMFLISISLAVGAIPEGLPAIIAITLAVAIKKMYVVNMLIRKLPAAETLGRATVICTDKTGTLTEEELTIDEIYSGNKLSITNLSSKKRFSILKGRSSLKKALMIGLFCNNAREEKSEILGDPTEIALIKAGRKFNLDKKKITEKNPRIKEYPFTSERKMMSIIRRQGEIKTSYVKGAPLFVLKRCREEFIDGKIKVINPSRRRELIEVSKKMEMRGLRVLGFAFRQITDESQKSAENNLIFSGFCGMIDPPRSEVKKAIKDAIYAGINVKIITGDSEFTTRAVADKIGLKGEGINGNDLENLSEEKWDKVVRTKTIFARVTPQQKLKIVEVLKKQNETVAVTGDGVNDILALKKADIGISMGIRGSDIARDSSDIVLLDDNFATIMEGVKQGRRVFANMRKSIKFLLSANAAQIFIIILALIIGMPLPFLPLAILWMNLVTDSLPALALAVEPAEKGILKKSHLKKGLLSGIWQHILIAGIINLISVIWIFSWAFGEFGIDVARTIAITTAIFFELFFVFSCKSDKSLFKTGISNNMILIYAVLISSALHILAIYTGFGNLFGFVSLSWVQLLIAIGAGTSGIIFFEGLKIGKMIRMKMVRGKE